MTNSTKKNRDLKPIRGAWFRLAAASSHQGFAGQCVAIVRRVGPSPSAPALQAADGCLILSSNRRLRGRGVPPQPATIGLSSPVGSTNDLGSRSEIAGARYRLDNRGRRVD